MFIIVEMFLEKWSSGSVEQDLSGSTITIDDESIKKHDKSVKKNYDDCRKLLYMNKSHENDLKKPKSLIICNNIQKCRDIMDNNNNSSAPDLNNLTQIGKNCHIVSEEDNNNNNYILSVPSKLKSDIELKQRRKEKSSDNFHDSPTPGSTILNSKESSKTLKRKVSTVNLISTATKAPATIDSSGYLNLIANGFDNFTHGLAIGASFLIGPKVGVLTTFVIIIHEIPHEICDYAILVNSGFSRWEAVKAQSSVSLFGILGTATALYVKSVETLNAKTVWILPFSAGGFLYIALVNLLPEILDKKTDPRNTLGQIGCVVLGIAFMASVAIF